MWGMKRWTIMAGSWRREYEGVYREDIQAVASGWEERDGWGHWRICPEEHEPTSAGSQVVVKPISTACHMEKEVFSYNCNFL